MRAWKAYDVVLIVAAVLGATAAVVLVGVTLLHGTRLDALTSGQGPFHGFGWILAIPVVIGMLAGLLLISRRRGRS